MLNAISYNTQNTLLWGLCREHYVESSKKGCSLYGAVHLTLALLETLPIASQIISTIEAVVFSLFSENNITKRSSRSHHHKMTGESLRSYYKKAFHKEILPILKSRKYTLSDGTEVRLSLRKGQRKTQIYRKKDLDVDLSQIKKAPRPRKIEVREETTIDGCSRLIKKGFKIVALNMANEDVPGGGVLTGCLAQEEFLCRLTTLYAMISPDFNSHLQFPNNRYKIPEDGCIFSPDVAIFRKEDPVDHTFIPLEEGEIEHIAVVSSAAVDLRHGRTNRHLTKQEKSLMKEKIRSHIKAAILSGCDACILSAFGCGAFGNDPELVASLYKKILIEEGYGKYFKRISFSILVASEKDQRNLAAFKRVFA